MDLGRLEEVDVREAWPHEAHNFTPWLLEHGDHLAEALGIDVDLEQSEHPVGGFSLDLIGRDMTNDAVLIVENQLASTDHVHLGQILTYAAGTDASTIVWVATGFRDEHRQALDWLNEQTREDVRFFGIEVSVVRIGGSAPAPLFRTVAEPNNWQKHVRTATRSSGRGSRAELYRAFWTAYLERVQRMHPDWSKARTPSDQNWMDFPSPIRGTRINPSFANGKRLRHELYIDSGNGEDNDAMFNHLLAHKDEFEAAYGRSLVWEDLPNARACRIADYRGGAEVTDESDWSTFLEWFLDSGVRLRRAIDAVDAPA